jgi:hypothetical protein
MVSNDQKLLQSSKQKWPGPLFYLLKGLRDWLLLLLMSTLNAIEGGESGVFELDAKAVVLLGLDTDGRDQTKSSLLAGVDLGDATVNLGLITEDIFRIRLPPIVVGGVAVSHTSYKSGGTNVKSFQVNYLFENLPKRKIAKKHFILL